MNSKAINFITIFWCTKFELTAVNNSLNILYKYISDYFNIFCFPGTIRFKWWSKWVREQCFSGEAVILTLVRGKCVWLKDTCEVWNRLLHGQWTFALSSSIIKAFHPPPPPKKMFFLKAKWEIQWNTFKSHSTLYNSFELQKCLQCNTVLINIELNSFIEFLLLKDSNEVKHIFVQLWKEQLPSSASLEQLLKIKIGLFAFWLKHIPVYTIMLC